MQSNLVHGGRVQMFAHPHQIMYFIAFWSEKKILQMFTLY